MINTEHTFGKRYKDACIANSKFSHENNKKIVEWMKRPYEEQNTLLICGSPGTGKTYFAAGLVNLYNERKFHYRYFTDYDFISEVKETFSKGWDPKKEVIRLSESAPLFILDDLGSLRVTEWEHEQFHTLIDHRYKNQLPTVIISNLTTSEFKEKFEPRFVSRLFSDENVFLDVSGPDLRQQGF